MSNTDQKKGNQFNPLPFELQKQVVMFYTTNVIYTQCKLSWWWPSYMYFTMFHFQIIYCTCFTGWCGLCSVFHCRKI